MSQSHWQGVCCSKPDDKSLVASWFGSLVEGWEALKADILVDEETDTEKKIRCLFRDERGRLREAVRTLHRREWTIKIRQPGADILKGFRP